MLLASLRALTCESQVSRGAEILHLLLQEVVVKIAEVAVKVPIVVAAHIAIMVAVRIAPMVLVLKERTKEIKRMMGKEEEVKPGGRTNMTRLGRRRRNRVSTILALILTNVKNVWGDIPVLSVFDIRFFMKNLAIFVKITGGNFFTPPSLCRFSKSRYITPSPEKSPVSFNRKKDDENNGKKYFY